MTDAFARLAEDRAVRDAARAVFDANLAQVRADLDARGVGGRIAARAGDEARDVMAMGIEIADENRGVVAATLTALVLWLVRNPLIAAVENLFGDKDKADNDAGDGDDD